jgi:flagellar basal-body rod modification protein FlgD
MASSVNSLFSNPGTTSTNQTSNSSSSSGLGGSAPSEGVFLQLLVSQLQNQDPLNPADSTTFVTQLAQFSELEQAIGIRSDTDTLVSDAAAASSQTSSGTNGTSNTGSNSNTSGTNQTTNN